MGTVVTVVVDNIGDLGLSGEWGLCLLIEHNDKKILLDAGSSKLFLTNLKCLGFDVQDIDYGVLSHAHYDHGNGIPAFFNVNKTASFYMAANACDNCYHKRKFFKVYIGIPKGLLKRYPTRIKKVYGDYKLSEGVYLISHKTPGLSEMGKRELMYVKKNRKLVSCASNNYA